jgi:crotonobetainyl-CoA:carnitine CoA-transferase CaiB-like acyl-CoA transferase
MTQDVRPLQNLRVLDFSWVWSGPLVTSILAEFGAQVIKVEHGARLDNSRLRGKPLRDGKPVEGPSIETGPYFHQTNHDKLSITVNLKSPEARELLDALVGQSDVLVENLSPGALTRAGLGYEHVSAINPRLIYLSMAAAGQTGPLSGLRAYAPIMSSYCGFETLVGYEEEPPIGMMNFGYGDPNAAVHALLPLLAAIYDRESSGVGQHIDMSQIEALLSVVAEPLIDWFMNQREARPTGNRHPTMCPHGMYPVAGDDRWVSIAVADDAQWQSLTTLMGSPDWSTVAELSQAASRLAKCVEIDQKISHWTRGHEQAELVNDLRKAGIACSPVQDVAAQQSDPHFIARGIRQKTTHSITGEEQLYRTPWTLASTQPRINSSAPLLGQHNDYVFEEILGLDTARIAALKASGVIA